MTGFLKWQPPLILLVFVEELCVHVGHSLNISQAVNSSLSASVEPQCRNFSWLSQAYTRDIPTFVHDLLYSRKLSELFKGPIDISVPSLFLSIFAILLLASTVIHSSASYRHSIVSANFTQMSPGKGFPPPLLDMP